MKKGVIALPTIILIGGIILEIVLTLSLVSYLLLQSGAGSKFSAEALVYAQAGIDDAIIKSIRNNVFTSGITYQHTITIDIIRQASVVACKDFEITDNVCDVTKSNPGKIQVISSGRSFNKNRRLQAFINVDQNSGEVKIGPVQEIPF